MDNKFFIYIGVILFIFYVFSPVPYCRDGVEETPSNRTISVFTTEEVLEIKNLTVLLLRVKGESMLPALQEGNECLCIKKKDYKVGDIVFFFAKIKEEIIGVSHRIVKINQEEILVKGDNNNWIDPPLKEENIVCSIPERPRWMPR